MALSKLTSITKQIAQKLIGTAFGKVPSNADIVYPVANVTALRALTGFGIGQSFQLEGHTNAGAGGGALLCTKIHGSEVDDDSYLFVVDGFVIERSLGGQVNTEMAGAVTGADNTDEIKASLATGKHVHATTTSTVTSDLHVLPYSVLQGEYDSKITITDNVSAITSQLSDGTDKTGYAHVKNVNIEGPGKAVNGASGINLQGDVNHAWNVFQNIRVENCENGHLQSAGWNNITMACDFRVNVNGVKYEGSPIQAGWAGSGQTSIGCQYGFNTTGINEDGVPWMNTYINPILEGNTLGFRASGQNTVLISPWYESNTDNFIAKRGFTQIGGTFPGWDASNITFQGGAEEEHLAFLDASKLLLTRGLPDGSDANVHITGLGAHKLQSPEVGGSTVGALRIGGSAWTQGGDTLGLNTSLHAAYFPSRLIDRHNDAAQTKVIDVQYRAMQDTNAAKGQLDFFIGKFVTQDSVNNATSTPLSLKLNVLGTGADNVNDIGESGAAFKDAYVNSIKMRSPNGTLFTVTVDDAGALVVV